MNELFRLPCLTFRTNPKFRSVLLHFQKYPNKDYTIILPSKKKAVQKWLQTNNQQEPKDFGADFLKETPLTPSLNSVVFRTLSNIYDETFWLKRAQPVNYFCYKLHLSLTGFRICRRLELIKISLEISKLILLKKMFLNNGLGVGVLTPFNYFYYSFIWMFY